MAKSMDTRRRITSTVLAASGALFGASACATDDGMPARDSVVVATQAAPASLDFTSTGGAAVPQAMMSNVYETCLLYTSPSPRDS